MSLTPSDARPCGWLHHVTVLIRSADGVQRRTQTKSECQYCKRPKRNLGPCVFGGNMDGSRIREGFGRNSLCHEVLGRYSYRVFKGIGHNVLREALQDFAKAVVEVDVY